ncbi:TPA: hypothetical protein ACH3X2_012587 [Trebouxia sp. C0005]
MGELSLQDLQDHLGAVYVQRGFGDGIEHRHTAMHDSSYHSAAVKNTQLKQPESPEVTMIFSSPEELLRVLPEHAKSSSTTARKELKYDSEGLSSTPSRGSSSIPGFEDEPLLGVELSPSLSYFNSADISPDRRPQDCASDEASSLPLRHQESPIDVDQHQALQTGPLLSRPGSRTGMTAAVSARQLLSRAHAKTALVVCPWPHLHQHSMPLHQGPPRP